MEPCVTEDREGECRAKNGGGWKKKKKKMNLNLNFHNCRGKKKKKGKAGQRRKEQPKTDKTSKCEDSWHTRRTPS